ALYVLLLRRGIPESPRFLAARGRQDEAEAVMARVQAASTETGAAAAAETKHAGESSIDQTPVKGGRWAELFHGILGRRTLMLWILWFGIVFSYYGIFTWLPSLLRARYPLVTSFQYTLIITLAQVPGYFSAAFLVERWGRKLTLVIYLLACAVGAYFFRSAGSPAM